MNRVLNDKFHKYRLNNTTSYRFYVRVSSTLFLEALVLHESCLFDISFDVGSFRFECDSSELVSFVLGDAWVYSLRNFGSCCGYQIFGFLPCHDLSFGFLARQDSVTAHPVASTALSRNHSLNWMFSFTYFVLPH